MRSLPDGPTEMSNSYCHPGRAGGTPDLFSRPHSERRQTFGGEKDLLKSRIEPYGKLYKIPNIVFPLYKAQIYCQAIAVTGVKLSFPLTYHGADGSTQSKNLACHTIAATTVYLKRQLRHISVNEQQAWNPRKYSGSEVPKKRPGELLS